MRVCSLSAPKLRSAAAPLLVVGALAATAGVRYAEVARLPARPHEARYETAAPGGVASLVMNAVRLPIEVMGGAGTTVAVELGVSNPAGVDSLYLVGHALGFHNSPALWDGSLARDGKVSVRINGGPWRPLTNDAARLRWPERAYLGIGGAYHTVRLALPVSGVTAGANTVEFRLNATEGVSSGFRILQLDLRAGTQSRVDGTQFVQDEPETWTPPAGGDAARGRAVWERRNSLVESPLPGARPLVASCADCHAYSGYDLKYFNYSNASIEARARFHGLSAQDGRDVAAYIRGVDLDRSDGRQTSPYARPWNPPYQPGPGLTARGEEDWAAGAGLEWVLDNDDETARWLFPTASGHVPNDAPTDRDLERALHIGTWAGSGPGAFGNRLDIQNTPIAIQYPDWNNWLPDIHPLDAFGFDDFTTTETWTSHFELYERFDTPAELEAEIQLDRQFLTCTGGCGRAGIWNWFARFDYEFDDFPWNGRYDISYGADPARFYLGKLSLMQWEAVKSWEVFSRFRMQNLGPRLFGGLTTPAPWQHAGTPLRFAGTGLDADGSAQRYPFFWPAAQSVVFDMAPHKNGEPGWPHEGPYGPQGTGLLQNYFSTAWYDLQLVTGSDVAGFPSNSGGAPVDWNYQTELALAGLQSNSGVGQWWRAFRARAIAVQSRNNYFAQATTHYNYAFNGGPGFTATNANWWEVLGWYPQNDGTGWAGRMAANQPLARRAAQAYLQSWFGFAASVPTAMWQRNSGVWGECCGYQGPNVMPTPYTSATRFQPYSDADNLYRLPPLMLGMGMRPTLVDSVARWGEAMWPLGNFEQWFLEGSAPPSIELTRPSSGSSYVAPAHVIIEAAVATPGSTPQLVEFYADGAPLGFATAPPFRITWENVGTGSYTLTARVLNAEGLEATSGPVAVTVAPEGPPGSQAVTLQPGWNLVSSHIAPADPSIAAVLGGALPSVRLVRDGSGAIFYPEQGVNTIGAWRPGEAYQVFATASATFVVTGTPLVPEATPLVLPEGWSQVAYLRETPMSIEAAMASVADRLTLVKDAYGAVYLPQMGVNQIGNLIPGQGYKVYLSAPGTLVYPANGGSGTGGTVASVPGGGASAAGPTMTVMLDVPAVANGHLVRIRTAEGLVVGEGVVAGGRAVVAVRGRDPVLGEASPGAADGAPLAVEVVSPSGEVSDRLRLGTPRDFLGGEEGPLRYRTEGVWLVGAQAVAAEFTMGRAYPNPFRTSVTIPYELPAAAHVDVQVFDLLGRLVATLVSEPQEAGPHAVGFQSGALPGGTYLCRIRAGDRQATRLLVLAR